jgi:hypothetical protein
MFCPRFGQFKAFFKVRAQLDGINGSITVTATAITKVPGTHRVYNMTVQGEHFYRVVASWCIIMRVFLTPHSALGTT